METPLRILVTNDDGIDSPGIWALAEAMSHVGETLLVAPKREQSGAAASMSLHTEIAITSRPSTIPRVQAYAVDGTPADCIVLGLHRLAQGRIGLVVSGINLGANMGNDILLSGTVMATLQAYFRKIPAMAVSLVTRSQTEEPTFEIASHVAEYLALGMRDGKIPVEDILNVNVPNIAPREIKGVAVTDMARRGYARITEVPDGGQVRYSRSVNAAAGMGVPAGTDIWATSNGLVSITPLRPDITDRDAIPCLAERIKVVDFHLPGSSA